MIKLPDSPLQSYPFQQLSYPVLSKNNISYENTNQEHILLEQPPEPQQVFKLLKSLHPNQPPS